MNEALDDFLAYLAAEIEQHPQYGASVVRAARNALRDDAKPGPVEEDHRGNIAWRAGYSLGERYRDRFETKVRQ